MAEIKIEKKTPIWPWIVGALLLAAVIYFFVFNKKATDEVVVDEDNTELVVETTVNEVDQTAITEYENFVANGEMTMDHTYNSEALIKLIAATRNAASNNEVDVNADLDQATRKANDITNNPQSLEHANMIKDAGTSITKALKTIQSQKFTNLDGEVTALESSIAEIDPKKPTLEQKDAIKGFFNNASTLLTSIKNSYGQER